VFISPAATHLLVVLAKLGVALSSLIRIAGHVAITGVVAVWYVAFAHVTNATFGRDLIPTRLLAQP
jgi:succinate-acetate transporter protein